MMKFFSLILSSLILVQSLNISFEDISKLNVLLEHAEFHQQKYGDSFFEFLSEHYGEKTSDISNKHKEHKDLPFKHDSNTHNNLNWTIVLNGLFIELKNTAILTASKANFFYKESISIFEKQSVFQPPKLS